MPYREDSYFVLPHEEAIQRDIAGCAVGDHQLADVPMDASTEQRVCAEVVNRGADRIRSGNCSLGVFTAQELECPLQVIQRACRVDYRRQGFGRSVAAPRANRSIQA